MKLFSPYQIDPNADFKLGEVDPSDKSQFNISKKDGKMMLSTATDRLVELHRLLYAQGKHRVLIVVQAIDAGGKDGTIREVFGPLDPMHFHVASFKAPSSLELSHDYLWRIHRKLPRRGQIVVFNRSHYEDIVAVRVRGIYPKTVWEKRYEHIVNFEKMLTDEGMLILKFFLCISKDEQLARFQKRIARPDKRWKFNQADLNDRERWDEFMQAYQDAIDRTSTDVAPWFVIPANRKWHRNLAIAEAVGNALESLEMTYPEPDFDPAAFAEME